MRNNMRIYIANSMFNVFNYARKRIMANARMDDIPMTIVTRILGEDAIVDGDLIVIKLPNGNPIQLKRRIKSI